MTQKKDKTINWFWVKNIFLGILFLYFIFINIAQPSGWIQYTWHYGIWFPITSYIVFWEGRRYFKAYIKLIKGILDMDTLIAIAAHTLYIFSIGMAIANFLSPMFSYDQMWEGPAALIIITNIGHRIEENVKSSSIEAYNKLNDMMHSQVIHIIDGKQVIVDATTLKIGDVILIKKGEMIPIDGCISSDSHFNYANITGESKSVFLKKGEIVVSGSYNLGNTIQIELTINPEDSTLALIIEKIEDVSMSKPKLQKLADKILRWFVPAVLFIAFLTLIAWLIVGYTTGFVFPWMKHGESSWIIALSAAVTVIAIACPCALGIATPLIYSVSSLLSTERGILINEPKALEELEHINIFAFDKTGTITNELFDIESVVGDEKWIGVAKGLEEQVKHPIAATILQLPNTIKKVTNITIKKGGVKGKYKNHVVEMKRYDDISKTTNVALYVDGKAKLIFKFKNTIKDGVVETIKFLKSKGIRAIMITGDNKNVADEVAKQVGIDEVFSGVEPLQKQMIIKKLQEEGKVAFIGDGFNDAIAIKQANVSISFASGSQITNSLSDMSILNDSFMTIIDIIVLSKLNNVGVKIALMYAFAFNIITIPVAILLFVQPWMGASIMATSDILVALNAYFYKGRARRRMNKLHTK